MVTTVDDALETAYKVEGWEVYNEDFLAPNYRVWARKKISGKYQYQRKSGPDLAVVRYELARILVPYIALVNPSYTPAPPNAPSSLGAAAGSSSTINLTWTDASTNEVGFKIEESSNGVDFSQIATVNENTTSYPRTGLSSSTLRYYRVRSYNDAGNSAYSNTASATTSAEAIPAAPSGLAVSTVSNTVLSLTWTDNSSNETGFKVEESANGVSGWIQIDTDTASPYVRSGLTAATTYYYRVRAYNGSGDSAYSNVASGTTGDASSVSPTGYEPRMLWTGERQAVFDQMVAANHSYLTSLYLAASSTGTVNEFYGDNGLWASAAYQYTGNTTYGQKALNKLRTYYNTNLGYTDFIREQWINFAIVYEFTTPLHQQSDRDSWVATINNWATTELSYWGGADSDQGTGAAFFGIALTMLQTQAYNPMAAGFLTQIGGLDSTAGWETRSTPRDALKSYCHHSAGGVWPEGTEYSLGTVKLLIMGHECLKTFTDVDHTPEITALLDDLLTAYTLELLPGWTDCLSWGDVQLTRTSHPRDRSSLMGLLSGIGNDPLAHYVYHTHVSQNGVETTLQGATGDRPFFVHNPYATRSSVLPTAGFASGQGILYWHDTWAASGKSLFIHARPRMPYVHHEWQSFGNFQFHKNGEWIITHPQGYGLASTIGPTMNMMPVGGLSGVNEIRENTASSTGPYPYLVSRTGGAWDPNQTYQPPPEFLTEHIRTVIYLPGTTDTIIVRDYVNGVDPKALQTEAQIRNSYNTFEANQIMESPSFAPWYIHARTEPTVAGNAATWTTAGGVPVRVDAMQTPSLLDKQDLSVLWAGSGTFAASELKWQLRFDYTAGGTFVHVIQMGTPASVSLLPTGVQVGSTQVTFNASGVPTVA